MGTPLSVIAGVTIDSTNAADPVLKIPYSAIASSIGWTTPTTNNLDPWVTALLQKLADYNLNNPSVTSTNVVVGQPTANQPSSRNGTDNRPNSRYIVTVWSTGATSPVIDGDNL